MFYISNSFTSSFETHVHLGDSLPQLSPLPLALIETRVQVIQLTLHLLLLVLDILFGTCEGPQVGAHIRRLLLQGLLGLFQSRPHLEGERCVRVCD